MIRRFKKTLLGNTTSKVVFFMSDKKEDDKKKARRFIDTYVVKIKPAPESTRPSNQTQKNI